MPINDRAIQTKKFDYAMRNGLYRERLEFLDCIKSQGYSQSLNDQKIQTKGQLKMVARHSVEFDWNFPIIDLYALANGIRKIK